MPGGAGRSVRIAAGVLGVAPFEGARSVGRVVWLVGLMSSGRHDLGVWFVNSGREHLVSNTRVHASQDVKTQCLRVVWCLVFVLLQFLCSCVTC